MNANECLMDAVFGPQPRRMSHMMALEAAGVPLVVGPQLSLPHEHARTAMTLGMTVFSECSDRVAMYATRLTERTWMSSPTRAAVETAHHDVAAPGTVVRYEGETALVKNLPKVRDLITTEAGARVQDDNPDTTAVETGYRIVEPPLANGFAADVNTTAANAKIDEGRIGATGTVDAASTTLRRCAAWLQPLWLLSLGSQLSWRGRPVPLGRARATPPT